MELGIADGKAGLDRFVPLKWKTGLGDRSPETGF